MYLWGLGFTATNWIKKPASQFERFFLNLAVGMAMFPFLVVFLNFVRVPLDWRIILSLSLIVPLIVLIKKYKAKEFKKPSLSLKRSDLSLLVVLVIFAFSFYTYATGAFAYPYLEDTDPWDHAIGVKYVALEKDAYDPPIQDKNRKAADQALTYIDPYPPSYDVFFGILHQTSPDLVWTLKFFNALIISLGFIFFYLFTKLFMRSHLKALFATFVLASLPSYLSHFIWAHGMIITILFPTLYAFQMIFFDRKWSYIAAISLASIWFTQLFSQPIKFTIFIAIMIIVMSIIFRRFLKNHFLALGGGVALSFIWWGAMISRHGLKDFLGYFGTQVAVASGSIPGEVTKSSLNIISFLKIITDPGGTASRAYTLSDFIIAKGENMINSPIGIGIVLSILTLIGLVYLIFNYREKLITRKENAWRAVAIFWLIYAFWGVNGVTFPISIMKGSFRVWMLLAIPVALISTEGFFFIINFFRKQKFMKYILIVIIILGVLLTSAQQKYEVNTSIWPTSGLFSSPQEAVDYARWFNTIPRNTKVLTYTPRDAITIGFGGNSCAWCQEVIDLRGNILNVEIPELHSFLEKNKYEYLIINGPMDARFFNRQFGENKTKQLLPQRYQQMSQSGLFSLVHQTKTFAVLKIIS